MSIKSAISVLFAKLIAKQIRNWSENPQETQQKVFSKLISQAENTAFGRDHRFSEITNYEDFKKQVPIRDYEELKPYIGRVLEGNSDILWPGKPLYFAKTSGTTSGTKYIPISRQSISYHINSARNALLMYVFHSGNSQFIDGKMIFLSGSPEMDNSGPIPTGRLSGIVNHWVPSYLKRNQLPTFATNCLDDWEKKVDAIVKETSTANMTLISGIPPWVQMYFDKLQAKSGKTISELFPHFSLFVYGGVNYEPYRAKLEHSIGKKIDSVETYPASEGFIAFQDNFREPGLLLLLDNGIFYEFIRATDYFKPHAERISIADIELNVNYAIILNTNAGLWGYSIGDTVKFISKKPYKIIVTGRIKHFLSAFGEHVIAEEVENALQNTISLHKEVKITEFTVAPQVNPDEGLPYHEWFIEFEKMPENMNSFANNLDKALQDQNTYYKDLIEGRITRSLVITVIRKGGFIEGMKSLGKLGGQNKVPRLSNDRSFASILQQQKTTNSLK